ncbi:MAG: hypothetical protein SFU98_09670 [Leptospiraceae bacterium]|nr:hypothetical protein [Leptospiraceae bacterium]
MKKKKKKAEWRALHDGKAEFLKILSDLNSFYRERSRGTNVMISHFREEVAQKNPSELNILLMKFGYFEFLVWCEIIEETNNRAESWIHIDGISHEREQLKEAGILTHPVFEITCMNDLYEKAEPNIPAPPEIE